MTSRRRISVSSIRPILMFEAASEMVAASDWPYRNARVVMRDQGGEHPELFTLMGTQDPAVIDDVERGEVHAAMLNPSAMLTLAVRGAGPFDRPRALRAIAIIPSYDQFAFAVTPSSGITSLDDIREKQAPLRVSIRGAHDPSTAMLGNEILKAHGFTLDDIDRWGGHVSYEQPLPGHPSRMGAVERGDVNAIFDEAVPSWVNKAAGLGMRFLPVTGEPLQRLIGAGFRAATIERSRYPNLAADFATIDFSGWPIYTATEAPDAFVTAFCAALESRKDRIPWEESGKLPLPLERMCRDAPDAPLDVPLHPAAERFWREQGYLET
jgi:TRAP-type uncharacterized transport system substrate-binding protein